MGRAHMGTDRQEQRGRYDENLHPLCGCRPGCGNVLILVTGQLTKFTTASSTAIVPFATDEETEAYRRNDFPINTTARRNPT